MKHLDSLGFETSPEDHQNLLPIKEKYGIKPEYGSCHTAVSKEGYVLRDMFQVNTSLNFLQKTIQMQ